MCWFVKTTPMLDFMQNVAGDDDLQKQYKEDPKGFLDAHPSAAGLSDEDKSLLLSDDHQAVLGAIAGKHA